MSEAERDRMRAQLDEFSRRLDARTREFKETGELSDIRSGPDDSRPSLHTDLPNFGTLHSISRGVRCISLSGTSSIGDLML